MVEINLLPQQYRKQTEPSAWRFATYALPLVALATVAGLEVATWTRINDLSKQIDTLRGEETALLPAKAEFDRLSAEKTQLEQVTNIAKQLSAGKTYWTNDLATFTSQLPTGSGVSVKSMTIKPVEANNLSSLQQQGIYVGKNVVREIDLTGSASSQQAVVNFLKTFENNPGFGVNFKSLQSEEDGKYSFTASVGVVGSPANATPAAPGSTPATPGTPNAPAAPAAPAGGPSTSVPQTGTGTALSSTSTQGGGNVN